MGKEKGKGTHDLVGGDEGQAAASRLESELNIVRRVPASEGVVLGVGGDVDGVRDNVQHVNHANTDALVVEDGARMELIVREDLIMSIIGEGASKEQNEGEEGQGDEGRTIS